MRETIFAVSAVCFGLFGCGAADEGSTQAPEPVGTAQQAVKSTCVDTMLCAQGYRWDSHSCTCVPDHPGQGETCGSRVCGSGEYCCNASCGTCVPTGYMCTQIACN